VYCHVQGDFPSDDNPKKETARMMLTMAREINSKFPDGKRHVSCYTCHRGATEPAIEPPAAPAQ
jgi:photosynthetic reaction center cytochrome c subunit